MNVPPLFMPPLCGSLRAKLARRQPLNLRPLGHGLTAPWSDSGRRRKDQDQDLPTFSKQLYTRT
eukprot:2693248-Heterocapsa_arctica.AAC.1